MKSRNFCTYKINSREVQSVDTLPFPFSKVVFGINYNDNHGDFA